MKIKEQRKNAVTLVKKKLQTMMTCGAGGREVKSHCFSEVQNVSYPESCGSTSCTKKVRGGPGCGKR